MPKAVERMEFRVDPERAELIRCGASLAHMSLSSFVVEAASERANRMIEDQRFTVVPSAYFDALLAALDDESHEPNDSLARAAKRWLGQVEPRR